MPAELTLHLVAADGHAFDIQIPAPVIRPPTVLRLHSVQLATIGATERFDGTGWQPTTIGAT